MKTNSQQKEIVVIEDHAGIRKGMEFIINSYQNFHCVSFQSAEEAIQELEKNEPDVILMDINLPGMDGIECTRIIREMYPHVLIMMCTVFEDNDKIFDALKAGAKGYILKRTAGEILIEAINDLLKGGAPMSGDIARKVVSSFEERKAETSDYPGLTKKENEILKLLSQGYSNKEIADRLFVSVNTIRTHVYHIYEKLHVNNRMEAVNKMKKPPLF